VTAQKILITGGCGFIGANLIRRIQALGGSTSLVVLDNETMGSPQELPTNTFAYERGDVRDLTTVVRMASGCDAIIHLAGHTRVLESIEDPEADFEANVRGTLNVLMAARKAGVPHVLLASTGGALFGTETAPIHEGMVPQPLSPYGASKLAMEGYAHAFASSYGLRTTALRFTNVYGPYSRRKGSAVAHFFRQILARQPITVYGDGSQARDFVFVEDLCDGILQALEASASGVFHLGSGKPTSIATLLDGMRDVVGPEWPFEIRYAPWRTGEVVRTYSDIDKAARTFGYRPKVSLDVGLPMTWRWFLDQ
jgi:UDP-glucose 4-epimerase